MISRRRPSVTVAKTSAVECMHGTAGIEAEDTQPDSGAESRSALNEPDERGTPAGTHAAVSALGRGMYRSGIGEYSGHGRDD